VIDAETFTPQGEMHLVCYTPPANRTEGGLWLPELCQQNFVEAKILCSGPGYSKPMWVAEAETWPDRPYFRAPMWAKPGCIVVFEKHSFIPIAGEKRQGFLRDSDIVALVTEDGDLKPLNDWIKMSRPTVEELTCGWIYLPEICRRREPIGTVCDFGPGKLVKDGKLNGVRIPVHDIMGLSRDFELRHQTLRWGDHATVLELGGEVVDWLFVRAGDIDSIQEEPDAGPERQAEIRAVSGPV
jgi:co-chaperonin GroES (HSP10)